MHDRNGKALADGDTVKLEGKIVESYPTATACDIVVEDATGERYRLTACRTEKVETSAT